MGRKPGESGEHKSAVVVQSGHRPEVGAFQSAEWALVKGLTGTDLVVDQALND